jgi:hypothetical protein
MGGTSTMEESMAATTVLMAALVVCVTEWLDVTPVGR